MKPEIDHRTQAITELAQSPELLRALYESTQQSETLYRQQKELAHKNIERARKLTQELHDLDIRRHEVQEKVNSVKEKERQWEETESEMYRAIQPWSLPALHSKLNHITSESEALSETLASSFLDSRGGAADPDTVAEFLREYRKARKAFHLRREWLARWNEERVRHA
jgi:chromosome segregation ATPase